MLNRVTLIGRLTKEAELRYSSNSGNAVTRFNLAVNRQFKRDETDFINVLCFKKLAENVAQFTGKGSLVAVEGRIQTRSYEKDGRRVYTFDVVADNVQFLSPKSENRQHQKSSDPFANESMTVDIDDDDLPF